MWKEQEGISAWRGQRCATTSMANGSGCLCTEAPLCALLMGKGLQRHCVAHGNGQQLSAGVEGYSQNEKATPVLLHLPGKQEHG